MGKWWGYVVVASDGVVRPAAGGCNAQAVWRPLSATIEERWKARFGTDEIELLRKSLLAVASQLDTGLPDSLPILGYGLFSRAPESKPATPPSSRSLPGLLSKVLLAFAIEFERDSEVSLAICANVLRLAGNEPLRLRDIPRMAGVSKEAVAMSLSFLEKRGFIEKSQTRLLVLTAQGVQARAFYDRHMQEIETRWQTHFGNETIRSLRETLEHLAGDSTAQRSPLFGGLQPYPDGWRASIPAPEGLPHYPMVLHRGGFPDGA